MEGLYRGFAPSNNLFLASRRSPSVPHRTQRLRSSDIYVIPDALDFSGCYPGEADFIYNHPLFPLLALILEKCELATSCGRLSSLPTADDICSSGSFNDDIIVFAAQMTNTFPSPYDHLDNLMIQAIQVLRFHLLEIEKVHELCENFCQRYISCLRGKIPAGLVVENARPEGQWADKGDEVLELTFRSPDADDEVARPRRNELQPDGVEFQCDQIARKSRVNCTVSNVIQSSHTATVTSRFPASSASASCDPTAGNDYLEKERKFLRTSDRGVEVEETHDGKRHNDEEEEEEEEEDRENSSRIGQRKRRGSFAKIATNVMRTWLFKHLLHPYPSEDEKKELADQIGLSMSQVNNWFINARRRIVQPMIDQSNRTGLPNPDVFQSVSRVSTNVPYLSSPIHLSSISSPILGQLHSPQPTSNSDDQTRNGCIRSAKYPVDASHYGHDKDRAVRNDPDRYQ